MRWWRVILAACAAAVLAPAAATAQQVLTIFGGGSEPLTTTRIPARITGMLSVTFHGDAAAGCARWGLCGYSGTVSWQPPSTATIEVDRAGGPHPVVQVTLFPNFNAGPEVSSGVTSASVAMTGGPSVPASRCLDADQSGETGQLPVHHGLVSFSLAHEAPSLLSTRCAGPRDSDVLPHLPAPTIPLTALEHGQRSVSLAASRALASHGFTGSISSTLVVHIGAPGKPHIEGNSAPNTGRPGREIVVTYRAKLSGKIVEEVRGAADPVVCRFLGSCGLTGTITVTPPTVATTAHLTVVTRATTPRRELLAAAGLGPGSPGRVGGFGTLSWDAGGTAVADLRQGSERCVETVPAEGLQLIMGTRGGRWGVFTFPSGVIGGPGVATHCPGPALSTTRLGTATAPLPSLDTRAPRIALTKASTVHDDGYRVRILPHLTLTLTRVKVRMTTVRIPPGETFPGIL